MSDYKQDTVAALAQRTLDLLRDHGWRDDEFGPDRQLPLTAAIAVAVSCESLRRKHCWPLINEAAEWSSFNVASLSKWGSAPERRWADIEGLLIELGAT